MLPGITPRSVFQSKFFIKADSLAELATKTGIDEPTLQATVKRFNGFARDGVDDDFARGASAYDRFYSDPNVTPNPNLGSIEKAPFYATKLWLGDIGTKGGLLTDTDARVLRKDDNEPIPGLYATGNTTASVMGDSYPGPGATLGPAVVFAYAGASHAADLAQTESDRRASAVQ